MNKEDKNIFLRSNEVQEIMSEIPGRIIRWGTTIIFIIIAVLLVGSYFFKYPDVVKAEIIVSAQKSPSIESSSNKYIVGKALLPAFGSGKVHIGQMVNVRLNNYPYQEFGYIKGIVKSVYNVQFPEGRYVAEISFTEGLITNYNITIPAFGTYLGNAEIITTDISLLERIIRPIRRIIKKHF